MKVKILQAVESYEVGDVVDMSEEIALPFIAAGKAEEIETNETEEIVLPEEKIRAEDVKIIKTIQKQVVNLDDFYIMLDKLCVGEEYNVIESYRHGGYRLTKKWFVQIQKDYERWMGELSVITRGDSEEINSKHDQVEIKRGVCEGSTVELVKREDIEGIIVGRDRVIVGNNNKYIIIIDDSNRTPKTGFREEIFSRTTPKLTGYLLEDIVKIIAWYLIGQKYYRDAEGAWRINKDLPSFISIDKLLNFLSEKYVFVA
jgi:hypothetical protein